VTLVHVPFSNSQVSLFPQMFDHVSSYPPNATSACTIGSYASEPWSDGAGAPTTEEESSVHRPAEYSQVSATELTSWVAVVVPTRTTAPTSGSYAIDTLANVGGDCAGVERFHVPLESVHVWFVATQLRSADDQASPPNSRSTPSAASSTNPLAELGTGGAIDAVASSAHVEGTRFDAEGCSGNGDAVRIRSGETVPAGIPGPVVTDGRGWATGVGVARRTSTTSPMVARRASQRTGPVRRAPPCRSIVRPRAARARPRSYNRRATASHGTPDHREPRGSALARAGIMRAGRSGRP
jgi:hypothetical protein